MVKERGSGPSAARVTSYLMQPWQLKHRNLSRKTPRIGWWWGWRACMSARWSIRCCALAWSSETVSGRHLQGTQQRPLSWEPTGMVPPWKQHSTLIAYLWAGSITVHRIKCNVDTSLKCPHLYWSSRHVCHIFHDQYMTQFMKKSRYLIQYDSYFSDHSQ